MFESPREILSERIHKHVVLRDAEALSFAEALRLWRRDAAFRVFFTALLAGSPFTALRWETPPVTAATVDRLFEFVLLDAPGLDLPPDASAFAEHFDAADPECLMVVFENLGADAVLVVPCPRGPETAYGHLASFVRGAPAEQGHELWRAVGAAMETRIGHRPVWLSTAGGGVPWLHVRLDDRPKYYGYSPYRDPP